MRTRPLACEPWGEGGWFYVVYQSDAGIDVSSIDSSDLRVTGPGGFSEPVQFVDLTKPDSQASPRSVVARYRIAPPAPTWLSASRSDAASEFLRQEVEGMLGKVGGIFGHDELGPVNDPCYFLQFINWAAEHELAYLGESPWIGLTPGTLPLESWLEWREAAERPVPAYVEDELRGYLRAVTALAIGNVGKRGDATTGGHGGDGHGTGGCCP